MKIKSARLLNERPGWLGLSIWDLGVVGYTLIFSHAILTPLGLELFSFLVGTGVLLVLLKIRLRSRPKTIRDYIKNKITSSQIR